MVAIRRGGTGFGLLAGCQWIVVERAVWSAKTGKPGAGSVWMPRQTRGLLAQVRSMVLVLCVGMLGGVVRDIPWLSAQCRKGSAPAEVMTLVCQRGWCRLKSPATRQGLAGRVWLWRCFRPCPASTDPGGALYRLIRVTCWSPDPTWTAVRSRLGPGPCGTSSALRRGCLEMYVRVRGLHVQTPVFC